MNSDSKADILKLALPGVLLGILLLAPFLNKAFTIDDPTFLLEARQILQTPLQPWSPAEFESDVPAIARPTFIEFGGHTNAGRASRNHS
jgi:hypothetical protein